MCECVCTRSGHASPPKLPYNNSSSQEIVSSFPIASQAQPLTRPRPERPSFPLGKRGKLELGAHLILGQDVMDEKNRFRIPLHPVSFFFSGVLPEEKFQPDQKFGT